MPAAAKERTMRRFKEGEIQLLVATTVIEVGVDVPNATLMVIENAERMGLAQLHQLRGRVGRGQHASSCLLLYRAPLSPLARERLAVMRDTNDGFEVARRDLELRGPGELLLARARPASRRCASPICCATPICCRGCRSPRRLLREWPLHVRRSSGAGWDMRSNTAASGRMPRYEPKRDRTGKADSDSVQWLPAERLGQLTVDAQLRPWLIGKGC
jgi:ATP-dependent DNA helicase RecG